MNNNMSRGAGSRFAGKKLITTSAVIALLAAPVLALAQLTLPAGWQDAVPTAPSGGFYVGDSGSASTGNTGSLTFDQTNTGTDSASQAGDTAQTEVPAFDFSQLYTGTYASGPRLIKLEGSETVYWVSEGNLKIPMLTRAVFLSYNNRDEDVATVSQEEFDYYQDAKYIWLDGKGGIYKVDGTNKRIISVDAWTETGMGAEQVISVNKADFNSYKTGSKITAAEDVLN